MPSRKPTIRRVIAGEVATLVIAFGLLGLIWLAFETGMLAALAEWILSPMAPKRG